MGPIEVLGFVVFVTLTMLVVKLVLGDKEAAEVETSESEQN